MLPGYERLIQASDSRVVVLCVFLTNAHTWGLNSVSQPFLTVFSPPFLTVTQSYAVFLAYYINSGEFDGASDITFAFVGGLSFSIGDYPSLTAPRTTLTFQPSSYHPSSRSSSASSAPA